MLKDNTSSNVCLLEAENSLTMKTVDCKCILWEMHVCKLAFCDSTSYTESDGSWLKKGKPSGKEALHGPTTAVMSSMTKQQTT